MEHNFTRNVYCAVINQSQILTNVISPKVLDGDIAVPPAVQVEELAVQDGGVLAA
jgi:hypothetical protein